MRLEPTTLFTGVRSGTALKISLPAPAGLRLGLPAGAPEPSFSRSTVSIDPATGALTLTANSGEGTLRVAIADASRTLASGTGLSSQITLRVPVFGAPVSLSGQISYPAGAADAASVSLSGHLPTGAVLQKNVAQLAAGTAVTLSIAGGLRVSGPAILGRPGHQLSAALTGAVSGTGSGTFTVAAGAPATTPLPGLALSDVSGMVTMTRGTVRFDVHARTARPWTPVPGVSVAGAVEFANMIPNDGLVPAPGITGTTAWLDVAGAITVPSAVTVRGEAAVNLATGKGLLTGGGASAITLATTLDRLVLDQAGFRGAFTVGTGRPGTLRTSLPAVLTAAAKGGATAQRSPVVAAGATTRSVSKKTASAADGTSSYTLSGAVYNFLTGTLNIPLGSATLSGTLSGQTLTATVSAPTGLPSALPSWIPDPAYVNTQISVDQTTGTLTLTAATAGGTGMTATLSVTIDSASTSSLTDGTDVTGSLALGNMPFAGGYNQDWEFAQSPYPGYYEIMNRGSGQCLSVGNDSTAAGQDLVQYPCHGWTNQLWYMGYIAQGTDYNIWSALDSQVVDVQNAYPYAGGYVDQWPSNGGSNQTFWLTNSTN
jgi:hypothetical protein